MRKNVLIDKIFIFLISFFLMMNRLSGRGLIISVYMTMAVSALGYWLLSGGKEESRKTVIRRRAAAGIQILAAVICIFNPPALTAMPCVVYDIAYSSNIPGAAAALLALINALWLGEAYMVIAGILVLSLFAAYLSLGSRAAVRQEMDYHRLRDDSSEKSRRMKKQNQELERSRDAEIYTAQLAERNRIAREIHDNVGHMLSRALLQMGALLSIHKEEPVHSQLMGLRETLDTAMTNIRSSVHDLHEESIDVEKNIRDMAAPLAERFSVDIEVDVDEKVMPRQVKYALLGIIREAVSNIMKHSDGNHVLIRLIRHPALYQLIVHDWYEADPPAASSRITESGDADRSGRAASGESDRGGRAQSGGADRNGRNMERDGAVMERKSGKEADPGIGMENMRNRAESVGGTIHFSTEKGFRVFVSVPVKDE